MLEGQAIHPQHRRGGAVQAARRVADVRVARHVQLVAAKYQVGRAADRPALHLAEHRLGAAPDAHEAAHVVAHEGEVAHGIPGALAMVDVRRAVGRVPAALLAAVVRRRGQVVAGGEGVADATQHDGRHVARAAGRIDPVGDALDDVVGQRVLLFRAIDGDDRDAITLFVQGLVVAAHRALAADRASLSSTARTSPSHCWATVLPAGKSVERRRYTTRALASTIMRPGMKFTA